MGANARSNEVQVMQVISGEVNVHELVVKNPYDQSGVFEIRITDVDLVEGRIGSPEFMLVDGEEWKFWYTKGKCRQQDNYNFVDAKNMKMKMDGGKEYTILFKLLSLREPIVEFGKYSKPEPSNVISNELRPRSIKIELVCKDITV